MNIDVATASAAPPVGATATRRLLVVFNPVAGRNRRPRYDAILAALRAEPCVVTTIETTAPGHAERIARELSPEDVDVIVAAGGDGTVNEIVNGLGDKPIALGIIPLGTANVLADELKLPRKPAAIARTLARGAMMPIHTGVANGRRFCMMAGVGFDACVVAGVSGDLALKKRIGPLAYVVHAAKVAFFRRLNDCRVTIDGTPRTAASAVVCKGRFYGGPFVAVCEASVRDDQLHVVLMHGRGWINTLRYGVALMLGQLAKLSDVEIIRAASVTIAGDAGAPVQADGDIITAVPVTIGVEARPIAVVAA